MAKPYDQEHDGRYVFVVYIEAPTVDRAREVMRERMGYDEDLDFDYQIEEWEQIEVVKQGDKKVLVI